MESRPGESLLPDPSRAGQVQPSPSGRLRELAWLFLKLGTIAFGGPAAHIAMLEDEVVRRRRWLSHDRFLDMLGATNIIPGPNSTEMAIHIGYLRAGVRGLIVAGMCFILPAAIMVSIIAWAYLRFGKLPQAAGLLYGVKPIVIAVIVQALWRLGRTAIKTPLLLTIALLAAAANALGIHELLVLLAGALVVPLARSVQRRKPDAHAAVLPLLGLSPTTLSLPTGTVAAASLAASVSLWPLFLVFLKIGSVLFGSGYVLLAFLRADLVQRLHWLTEAQLLDATAVGQVTPGPVFTTATFIGWILAGPKGALIATVGIFLPAFIFVALTAPFIHTLRRSKLAGSFLDGLNVASLALMAVVTWQLGRAALVDVTTIALATISAALLVFWRVNVTWLIGGGAIIGLAMSLWR